MGALIRAFDWLSTPMGAPETWPTAVRTLVSVVLDSDQPMFLAWGADLTLIYNDGYAAILGDKHPRAIGRELFEVWSEIADEIAPFITRTFQGFTTRMDDIALFLERRNLREEAHFSFFYTPIRGDDGRVGGIYCAVTETTARVVAERRQAGEFERQRLMLRQMPGFAAKLSGPDHRYVYVNEAYEAISGKRDFIGRSVREVFPELEGQGFFELMDSVYASGEPHVAREMPVRLDRPDGQRFINLVYQPMRGDDGNISGIFVGGYEVTEAVTARMALAAERDRLASVLNGMGDGFALLDHDFHILDVNAAGLRIDDRSKEALVGRSHWDVFPGTEESELGKLYKRAMSERVPVALEHLHRWSDDRATWLDMRAYPVPEGLAIFFRDVSDRKQAETEARARSAELAAIFDATPAILLVARDPESKSVVGNRLAAEALRMTDATANISKSAPDADTRHFRVLDPNGVELTDPDLPVQRAARGEIVRDFEERVVFADGTAIDLLGNATPLLDEQGQAVGAVAAFVDITARKQVEGKLAESEERFRLALDAAGGIGTWDWDVQTNRVYTNRGFALKYGVDPVAGEAGLPVEDYIAGIHPEDREQVQTSIAQVVTMGGEFRAEYRVVHSQERWVVARGRCILDPQGRPQRFPGVTFDITDRKRAEQELRSLNADLECRVAEAISARNRLWKVSDDLFVTVGFDGRFVEASDSWTRVLGWGREALMQMDHLQLVHPDDLAFVTLQIGALKQGHRSITYDNRVRTADGGWRTIAWQLSSDDSSDRLYAVGRDVTVEREQSAALAAAESKIYEMQKLESIGQLTGGVAHDFNNLLSAILSNLEIARKNVNDLRTTRLIDGAIKGAERGAALTKRLLAFARRQDLKTEAIDLSHLLADMGDLLSRSLDVGVELIIDLPENLPAVRADSNQLELAILNIAVNARDAMPEGGSLIITGRQEQLTGGTIVQEAGDYVRLSIADTGTGMDQQTLRRATEPFFTTKDIGKGTGLGLSMVQGLVSQSGGAMLITSKPGAGTTIDLLLPVASAEDPPRKVEPAPLQAPSSLRKLKVLVVDDDVLVAMGTAAIIEDLGHMVIEANSAKQALEIVNSGADIDVVISDHAMPGTTGASLLRQLAELRPDLPTALATGYAELPNGEVLLVPRLAKPLRQSDLRAFLESISDKSGAETAIRQDP